MASRNLALGKGEVFFAQFKPGTQVPGGERFLGNCPEFTLAREAETLEHFSSTRGKKLKDDEETIGVTNTGSISCDDVQPKNLAIYFLGTDQVVTAIAAAAQEETFEGVSPGLTYQLGVTETTPTGVRKIATVIVTMGITPLVLGTDYDIDPVLARITLLEGSVTVLPDSDIEVTYDVEVSTRTQVITSDSTIEGALRFISFNPKGLKIDYFMPWVKLSPNGDIALITEEWMTIPLNVEALVKGELAPIYADGRPV